MEEYTRLTRRIINYVIKFVIALHVILLVVDGLPVVSIGVGIVSHVFYYRMLKTFPYISLTSCDFLGSAGLLILSHVVWIRFFQTDPRCAYVSTLWMLGFIVVMVWVVPFAFLVSLASNESVLPGGSSLGGFGSSDPVSHGNGAPRRKGRQQSTVIGLLNYLKSKRDEVLPMVSQVVPSSRRNV